MIDLSLLKELFVDIIKLVELRINNILVWQAYKNWTFYSTESDGETVYNGGLGYKNGYRVRSGGAEGSHACATCTGFIPAKGGDIVRMSGYDALVTSNGNAINVSDKNYANLGQTTSGSANYGYGIIQTTWPEYNWAKSKGVKEEGPGVYAWTVPPDSDIAFVRVTGYDVNGEPGPKMIVTVNEELGYKSGPKNWVSYSTESDGETIYNGGLGYKNGYRVRSGGAEGSHGDTACTGFIPVKGGDIVRIKGWTRYTTSSNPGNAINVADVDFLNIGQVSNSNYGIFANSVASDYGYATIEDGADGVSSWVVPPDSSGVKYIRVSAHNVSAGGAVGEQLIVTINEEII